VARALAKAAPDSPGLQDLDNAKNVAGAAGPAQSGRQQARGGNIPGALATWRSMFNGNTPPAGLAAEYYLTMASDKSLYPQALANCVSTWRSIRRRTPRGWRWAKR
jgi:hypothetical protein